uniref:Protein-tyrosine phosphatase n=1 Tax=Steinernema glaseri TaxID=37863 RepID=A0A1I7Z028_9BILA
MNPPEETKSENPPRKPPSHGSGRPLAKKAKKVNDLQTQDTDTVVDDNGDTKQRNSETKRKTTLRTSTGLTKAVPPEVDAAMTAFVNDTTTLGLNGLRKEFAELKAYVPPNFETTAFNANKERNRYNDIKCLDSSRVVLTLNVPPEKDYIHANWVKMDDCDRKFIATQGPLDSTISDFWRMVHQEGVTTIIMLCRVVESGKAKCAQYWPLEQGGYQTYGCMFVNNKKVEKEDKFTTYTLEVLPEGCSNSTITKLCQMADWPDRGVPQSPMTILRLLKLIVAGGPCVVHCSAGIGRTGTIIAIETALQRLMKGHQVNMKELVMQLRNQRASSVQTEGQYCFVHVAVINYIGKFEDVRKSFNIEFIKAALN